MGGGGYPKSPPGIPNRSCMVIVAIISAATAAASALGFAAWDIFT